MSNTLAFGALLLAAGTILATPSSGDANRPTRQPAVAPTFSLSPGQDPVDCEDDHPKCDHQSTYPKLDLGAVSAVTNNQSYNGGCHCAPACTKAFGCGAQYTITVSDYGLADAATWFWFKGYNGPEEISGLDPAHTYVILAQAICNNVIVSQEVSFYSEEPGSYGEGTHTTVVVSAKCYTCGGTCD